MLEGCRAVETAFLGRRMGGGGSRGRWGAGRCGRLPARGRTGWAQKQSRTYSKHGQRGGGDSILAAAAVDTTGPLAGPSHAAVSFRHSDCVHGWQEIGALAAQEQPGNSCLLATVLCGFSRALCHVRP